MAKCRGEGREEKEILHEEKNQLKAGDTSERSALSKQGAGAFNLLFVFSPERCLALCWGHNPVTATAPPGRCKSAPTQPFHPCQWHKWHCGGTGCPLPPKNREKSRAGQGRADFAVG